MLSKHEEQELRRQVLENDQQVRGSTFHQFGSSEAAESRGRFTEHSSATVIGSSPSPAPQYPAAADWTRDPVGPEMPLGVSINEMPTCGEPHELKRSIADDASPGRSFISSVQATASSAPEQPANTPLADAELAFSHKTFRRF